MAEYACAIPSYMKGKSGGDVGALQSVPSPELPGSGSKGHRDHVTRGISAPFGAPLGTGSILGARPPVSITWRRDRARLSVLPHPPQLERAIGREVRWRRHTELAAERDHLAGEPVELEAIAAFEVVRHRCLHA